jgi:hypothetical protein
MFAAVGICRASIPSPEGGHGEDQAKRKLLINEAYPTFF